MNLQYPSIHFLGIAGIGVSALAQVAQARGVRVSGSDSGGGVLDNPAIQRLVRGGATVFEGHRAENLPADTALVVASAAIPDSNPEVARAMAEGIRVVTRAEFLGELMRSHKGPKVAVAGTHGKTTTTGMLGVILQEAGLDPTVFVGGEVPELGGNVRIGAVNGPMVVEACEAYDSFLSLKPDIAVITNIEADHLDHFGSEERVHASFEAFLANITPDGALIACGDDPGVRAILDGGAGARRLLEYGTGCRFYSGSRAKAVELGERASFDWHSGPPAVRITLSMPGMHNVLNALAAATAASQLGADSEAIAAGLAAFHGARRRLDLLGETGAGDTRVLVFDDYAHHPTEIRATREALRTAYPRHRLLAVFQPHLYSRTRDFLDDFAAELAGFDAFIVTEIYAAREAPIPGVLAADIVNQAIKVRTGLTALYVPAQADIPAMTEALCAPGDVIVFMGAGDIRMQAEIFAARLQQPVSAG